jgi:preprotein translocase subunit SecE
MAANKDNAMNITDTTAPVSKQTVEGEGGFSRFWNGIAHFIREVLVELKKTNWPSRDELTKFTVVVMVTILVVSIYLFVADTVIGQIATKLFDFGTTSGLR